MVLEHVSFSIQQGEKVGIIGSNGVGKSTLLKLMVGIEPVSIGKIHILGDEVTQENLARIRQEAGYVFQDSESQLFMSTIYDDVAFAPINYGLDQEEVERRTMDALERVRIAHLAKKKIYQLSGGEKKLASIATVLSMEPKILLLDEPSVALDPQNRRNLIRVLNDLSMTKVIASHDLDFIYDTCDRTVILDHGTIAADGNTKELLRNKELLERNGLELPLSFSR
ncbi:MAG: ABC transporter ATP-binding protein [Lachnospiraceae bacterium]|nr:ABC transporter ATP-binding protein [Lachnospiraceae bacterium]